MLIRETRRMLHRRKPRPRASNASGQPPRPESSPSKSPERTGEGSSSALEAMKLHRRTRPGELLPLLPEKKKPSGA
jgi:hypothetical protein